MKNSKSGTPGAAVLVMVLIGVLLAIATFIIFSLLDDVALSPEVDTEYEQSLAPLIIGTGSSPQAHLGSGAEAGPPPATEDVQPSSDSSAEDEQVPPDSSIYEFPSDFHADGYPAPKLVIPNEPPGDLEGDFWEYDSKTRTITFNNVYALHSYDPDHYPLPGSVKSWEACWAYVRHIVIESEVSEIGYCAFYSCPQLETVEMKNGVVSIGGYAFSKCPELREVIMGDTVSKLYINVFADCPKLEKVKLSAGLTEMEVNMFYKCVSLKEITLPAALKVLPACDFSVCMSLSSVTMPVGLEVIEESAFISCQSLESITLPEGLTRVEKAAFAYTGLKEAYLPESLEYIAPDTFAGCTELALVRYGGSYEQWLELSRYLRLDEEVKVICEG